MTVHGCVFLVTVLFSLIAIAQLSDVTGSSTVRSGRHARFLGFGRKGTESGEVKFRLYRRGSNIDQSETNESGDKITFKKLDTNKPIKIIIHGWKGYEKCTFYREIVNAFVVHSDVNLIAVDWSGLGSRSNMYPTVRDKVPEAAVIVAKFIDNLHKQRGVHLGKLHILGHSLGAHIAGIAGYLVTTGKIGRITGLDPAFPLFSLKKTRERLSVDSAQFVDVIHSSSNLEGFGDPIGHADFYPNGPHMHQPGCGVDIIGRCSHRRSFYYYLESLSNPNALPAVPCKDWAHFQRKECDVKRAVPMGEATPWSARGSYYLATNKEAPFGKRTLW